MNLNFLYQEKKSGTYMLQTCLELSVIYSYVENRVKQSIHKYKLHMLFWYTISFFTAHTFNIFHSHMFCYILIFRDIVIGNTIERTISMNLNFCIKKKEWDIYFTDVELEQICPVSDLQLKKKRK